MREGKMIDTISIRNFKSLRDVRVGLQRFTVLVGPNGSGKSSVLQALNGLSRVFQQPPQNQNDGEINQALSRGAQGPVEITAQVGGMCYRYRSQFTPPGGVRALPHALEAAAEIGSVDW